MTLSFKTFGCRLNRAETARFEAEFAAAGFTRVAFGAPAEIVILHTCAITQSAENECLKLARALKKKNPRVLLVLVGCAVEAASPEVLRALPVDLIIPRDKKDGLVALVLGRVGIAPAATPVVPVRSTQRASLKIQDGCDFFCTYCIVPHTRGEPRSRPFAECLHEAEAFIATGFQEIVVTGCNIACYRDGGNRLVDLLAALAGLPGLGRLRLGSVEPGTVEREIVALMAATPKLCRFLHLPIQSGDNGVLARMGRRYTVEDVADTLGDTLRRMPNLGLGADIITGFPGETAEAFAQTRALIEAFPFSNVHVFPYSERPGTPASAYDRVVPDAERRRRAADLVQLKQVKRAKFAQAFLGRAVEVLVERFDASGAAHGWTGEYLDCQIVDVPRTAKSRLVACVPCAVKKETLVARLTAVGTQTGQG